MAAPSNAALLDYEANIEDAVASYLQTALGAGVQVLTPRTLISSEAFLETPRVVVSMAVNGTLTKEDARTTDNAYYRSVKTGMLTMAAVIRRDASGQSMQALRGGIRVAMLEATNAFTGGAISYYTIMNLIESSSSMGSMSDNQEIYCQLGYRLDFWIRPDMWHA